MTTRLTAAFPAHRNVLVTGNKDIFTVTQAWRTAT